MYHDAFVYENKGKRNLFSYINNFNGECDTMKVYKNGICREIDQKREQEFKEKGYTIEGKTTTDTVEVLKQEKEALKSRK